ncbi:MAG: helix-turn-helix transcriptional regulator [Rhodospirillales bacterium]|nr:helix-turn-helix transcriptional regulator [Rhodospirillales bacterium]
MQEADTMKQNAPTPTRVAKRVDEHVGERIRHLRTTLGLTQEQLASALGISYQQIQKYETGANRVSAGRLFEIAMQLDVEPAFFFADVDTKKAQTPMPHGGKNRTTIELVTNFSEITDPAVRSSVASLVRTLARKSDIDPETC